MRKIAEEEMKTLLRIKEEGRYELKEYIRGTKERRTQVKRPTLFKVLKQYLIFREAELHPFRARHFSDEKRQGKYNRRKYYDCPLSQGEYVNAIRYALKKGLVEELSGAKTRRLYKLKSV